jgi:hypothetical protein
LRVVAHNLFTGSQEFSLHPPSLSQQWRFFLRLQEKGHFMFKTFKGKRSLLMNLQSKLRFGLLAVAIALVPAAIPANAQQLYTGTFTMPIETKWGNVLMEPGQYTITVEEAFGQKLLRIHGPGELAMFATPSNLDPVGGNGKLTFVSVNGFYTLKTFSAGEIGQSFIFPVPKAKGNHAQLVPMVPLVVGAD